MNRAPHVLPWLSSTAKPCRTQLSTCTWACFGSTARLRFRTVSSLRVVSKPPYALALRKSYHSLPKCLGQVILEPAIFGRNIPRSQHYLLLTRLCSSQGNHSPKKVMALTSATYVSLFIGACMLTAVGFRFYTKAKYRARGIEVITDRDFSSRSPFFKYRGYTFPMFMVNSLDKIYHFDVRDDDVWIVTFPKAGTTWMQEIVYLIVSDLDFAGALSRTVDDRVPYFEFVTPGISSIDKMPSPRLLKSHLPLSLLPKQMAEKKPKIIYMARNPKDTAVSFFHFTKLFNAIQFKGDFHLFFNKFMADNLSYCPWWKHVKEGWEASQHDNVLFVRYEDMKKDHAAVVRRVADFLGKPLLESEVAQIVEHTSFARMKLNDMTNYSWWKGTIFQEGEGQFLRKGMVGDWKNYLTDQMSQSLETLVTSHLLPMGLTFDDEFSSKDDQQVTLTGNDS